MSPLILQTLGALGAYLLGAIPFGLMVARSRGVDIRAVGSGNIGATNVFRSVGKGWGLLTFLLDMGKGLCGAQLIPRVVAALAEGPAAEPSTGLALLCACLAVVGHNWPVFLRFKGGKGVATSMGALIGIAWQAAVLGLIVWILVLLISRYVSLASVTAAAALAAVSWWLYRDETVLLPLVLTLLGITAIVRHRTNIQRLLKGSEHRFSFKRTPKP